MALVRLIGVVEDGTTRRAGVPVNPRTTLKTSKGQDFQIEVTVVTSGGNQVSLAGTTPTLTIKKRPQDDPALLKYTNGDIVGNVVTFTLPSVDSKRKLDPPGQYVYDVWITLDSKLEPVVPLSPLLVEAAAFKP